MISIIWLNRPLGCSKQNFYQNLGREMGMLICKFYKCKWLERPRNSLQKTPDVIVCLEFWLAETKKLYVTKENRLIRAWCKISTKLVNFHTWDTVPNVKLSSIFPTRVQEIWTFLDCMHYVSMLPVDQWPDCVEKSSYVAETKTTWTKSATIYKITSNN